MSCSGGSCSHVRGGLELVGGCACAECVPETLPLPRRQTEIEMKSLRGVFVCVLCLGRGRTGIMSDSRHPATSDFD